MARLLDQYNNEIVAALSEKLGRKNAHSLPKLEKIIVSMGLGRHMQDRKVLEENLGHMATISGQKPQVTRARKSIAGFKLREGVEIGCRVTMRSKRMYEFLDRLISIVLPRVRDFRGLNPKAFDGHGNYSMGLTEQSVFPEINPDRVKVIHGMNITFVTTASSNEEGLVLLKEFGMPFQTDETEK